MVIAILIIVCLTLVAISVSLFLNNKAMLRTIARIDSLEIKNENDLKNLRAEFSDKLQVSFSEIGNKVDTSSTQLLESIETAFSVTSTKVSNAKGELQGNIEKLQNELKEKITEGQLANNKAATVIQDEIISFGTKLNNSLSQVANELKAKHDNVINSQQEWQKNLTTELGSKFNGILEEIKNPLPLD